MFLEHFEWQGARTHQLITIANKRANDLLFDNNNGMNIIVSSSNCGIWIVGRKGATSIFTLYHSYLLLINNNGTNTLSVDGDIVSDWYGCNRFQLPATEAQPIFFVFSHLRMRTTKLIPDSGCILFIPINSKSNNPPSFDIVSVYFISRAKTSSARG